MASAAPKTAAHPPMSNFISSICEVGPTCQGARGKNKVGANRLKRILLKTGLKMEFVLLKHNIFISLVSKTIPDVYDPSWGCTYPPELQVGVFMKNEESRLYGPPWGYSRQSQRLNLFPPKRSWRGAWPRKRMRTLRDWCRWGGWNVGEISILAAHPGTLPKKKEAKEEAENAKTMSRWSKRRKNKWSRLNNNV